MTTKGVILEQAAPSTTRIEPDGSGANPPLMPETEAEQGMWEKASPWVHGVLGVASFVPGLSVVTGALDAAIYTAEGELVEAGVAAASMIPGGKVVTTAGKAVKGVVGMVRGTGTVAKVVKGADAGVEMFDAAKVAKEAREAKEAAEAANAARKPKKEVTIKGRQHKVPCFHPFDNRAFRRMSAAEKKAYLRELAKQLKRQESVINSLSVNEYKAARKAFAAANRNPLADAAQSDLRERVTADIRRSIFEGLMGKRGIDLPQAEARATAQAEKIMSTLAALHDPDMVAGGWMHPEPSGMGRADVNSSIGGSWNQSDRVSGMDREADRAIKHGQGDQKMNVKLEPCRGRGRR